MSYVLGYNLSHHADRILSTLLYYRGMTAKQLTFAMFAPFQPSLSAEKSVYNYLRKLKNQGLVVGHKLQANVANGSIYYLTYKGYGYAKDMLNIKEDAVGTGWTYLYMEHDESNLGDLPYDLYVPPLKQSAHHLMLVDFLIQAMSIDEDDCDTISYRLNLYAAVTYNVEEKVYRYRPDAEVMLGNKKFAIEIDRASESHEQLLQKFETYKRYLDERTANEEPIDINGILFVVESKRRDHGIKRRWTNILSAFFKILGKYQNEINLIMTTLDAVQDTLLFELKRDYFESQAQIELGKKLRKRGFSISNKWTRTNTNETIALQATDSKSYRVVFNSISQEFESKLYIRYASFLNHIHLFKKIDDATLEWVGYETTTFYDKRKPYIVENVSVYEIDPIIAEKVAQFHEKLFIYSFIPQRNFSLFED